MNDMMRTTEGMTSFGQGNIDAMMKSGHVWATGLQALTQSMAALAQAQLDHTMSTWKAMSGVKSLKEVIELQTSLAHKSLEAAIAESSKLTEASMKLAEQTLAPLTARMSLAVEKFTSQVN